MKTEIKQLLSHYKPYDQHNAEQLDMLIEFVDSQDQLFGKKNPIGHITASAWIVDQDYKYVLLTHHVKLNRWLQLGGHTEEDESIFESALREAFEESGLSSIDLVTSEIFDLDVHLIPAYATTERHLHYDLRFLMIASRSESLCISNESNDLRWFELEEVIRYTGEHSIIRMIDKTRHL